jgi:hypothetical protein
MLFYANQGPSAVAVQAASEPMWVTTHSTDTAAVGTANNRVQVFYAGFFPAAVFWPLAVVVAAGSALGAARLLGGVSEALWSVWQAALGVIGLATLPQVS